MNARADKTSENKSQANANTLSNQQSMGEPTFQFADNRPEVSVQRKLQEIANIHVSQHPKPIQKKENNTGLPDQLKSGIENLSGYSMDDVKVHYNSSKPAQLQAHAYAQGTDIHLASGQEKHLPHEAWHVVQQKQGRVSPTKQLKNKANINDNAGLEKEADLMGAKALWAPQTKEIKSVNKKSIVVQGMFRRTLPWAIPRTPRPSGPPAAGGQLIRRPVQLFDPHLFNRWIVMMRAYWLNMHGFWQLLNLRRADAIAIRPRTDLMPLPIAETHMAAIHHAQPTAGTQEEAPIAQDAPQTEQHQAIAEPGGLTKDEGKMAILQKLLSEMEGLKGDRDYGKQIDLIYRSKIAIQVLEQFAIKKVESERSVLERHGVKKEADQMRTQLEASIPKFESHEAGHELFGISHGYSATKNLISMRKGRIDSPGHIMHEFSHAMDHQLGHDTQTENEFKETAITELTAFTVQAIIDSSPPISNTSKGMTHPGMPLIAMIKDLYADKIGIYKDKSDSWWEENIVPKALDRVAERIPQYKRAPNQGDWIMRLYKYPMNDLKGTPFPDPR
jgi:hypothetical protein